MTTEVETELRSQVGNYRADDAEHFVDQRIRDTHFVVHRLPEDSINKLHAGISDYRKAYAEKVRANSGTEPVSESALNEGNFFRQKFIRFMADKNASEDGKYTKNDDLRKTNPESATIQMDELLGEEGSKLYQLALEEEMNSTEYMNAVFRASTTHYEGEKWSQRPVVIVAGPSGCGKSFAAKAAVEKADQFLPKNEGDFSGNDVVAVDGGIAREVSQIRKLAIQVANNKGYTGISDLHSKSKVLEGVKDRVQEAAFATPTIGVVIPETFSDYWNKVSLLKRIDALPNTKAVFCRVDGEKPSLFQKIVAFMGSRRAWKTSGFESEKELDLNDTKLAESKAYGAGGFKFGQIGSKLAERWFKKHSREKLTMIIHNDLLLKKEEPPNSHIWVDAKQGDKGAILVSARAFKKWEELQNILSAEEKMTQPFTLKQFADNLPLPANIQTSAEMDLACARESIRKRIIVFDKELQKAQEKYGDPNHEKLKPLKDKLERLKDIYVKLEDLATDKKEEVVKLRDELKAQIAEMKENDQFNFFSKTKKALKSTVSALDKMVKQIEEAELKRDNQLLTPPPQENLTISNVLKRQLKAISHVEPTIQEKPTDQEGFQPGYCK